MHCCVQPFYPKLETSLVKTIKERTEKGLIRDKKTWKEKNIKKRKN